MAQMTDKEWHQFSIEWRIRKLIRVAEYHKKLKSATIIYLQELADKVHNGYEATQTDLKYVNHVNTLVPEND